MKTKPRLVQRLDYIKKAAAGKDVLHLGCANYPYTRDSIEKGMLLHRELDELASGLYGFDFDPEGLEILTAEGFTNLYRADLEKLGKTEVDKRFDVIIAGEMIEHLNNPGLFLEGVKRFMRGDTDLILTTVNAYCAMRFFAYALRGKGGENEPVHPDHVAYYSFRTLKLLLERAGFHVREFCFYDLGKEHRPHNPRILNFVNDAAVRVSPQLSDGIIARCRLK